MKKPIQRNMWGTMVTDYSPVFNEGFKVGFLAGAVVVWILGLIVECFLK